MMVCHSADVKHQTFATGAATIVRLLLTLSRNWETLRSVDNYKTNGQGRVAGKVALVSGAADGLGASHAALLARHGASVLLGDIDEKHGLEQAKEVRDEGLVATFAPLDVRSPADWTAAVAHAENEFGPVNVLVNNAGIIRPFGVE